MSHDKMTPEELARFCQAQNATYKVEFVGGALDAFMKDFNDFQAEAADEMLMGTGLKDARKVLKRIMAL
jgi:hypothetical protein